MLLLVWLAAGLSAHAAPQRQGDYFLYTVKLHETFSGIGERGLQPASAYKDVWRLSDVEIDRELPVGKVLRIPWPLLKTTPIDATVEAFGGGASLVEGSARRPLVKGQVLHEGAVIATGENAFVRLALPDATHLAIPSNSRVRLDRLRLVVLTGSVDRQISVQAGGLESHVTPMSNPSSHYVVMTPVAQSSVRGTEFRVTYDVSHARAASSVLKGAVNVGNGRTDVLVPGHEGVVATPAGLKGPFPLLPAPVPTSSSALQSGERLHFEFAPVPGAGLYHLAIGADPKVEEPIYQITVDKPLADAPALGEGVYYLRLTAVSREGLEGEPGFTSFIRNRGELNIVGAASQADGTTEFRWSAPGDRPASFRFILARRTDRDHPIVVRDGLTEGRYVAATPPGDYVWMVFAEHRVDGRKVEVVSDPQSLHVP